MQTAMTVPSAICERLEAEAAVGVDVSDDCAGDVVIIGIDEASAGALMGAVPTEVIDAKITLPVGDADSRVDAPEKLPTAEGES